MTQAGSGWRRQLDGRQRAVQEDYTALQASGAT